MGKLAGYRIPKLPGVIFNKPKKDKVKLFGRTEMKNLKDKMQARYNQRRFEEMARKEQRKKEDQKRKLVEREKQIKMKDLKKRMEDQEERRRAELNEMRQKEADQRREEATKKQKQEEEEKLLEEFENMLLGTEHIVLGEDMDETVRELSSKEIQDELDHIDQLLLHLPFENSKEVVPEVLTLAPDQLGAKDSALIAQNPVHQVVEKPQEKVAAQPKPATKLRCHNCGGRGHWKVDCKKPSAKQLKILARDLKIDLHQKTQKKTEKQKKVGAYLQLQELIPPPPENIDMDCDGERPSWVQMCGLE